MKKIFFTLALLILSTTVFASSQYTVIKDSIHVRVDSTVNSSSLGYLSKDDSVEVLEKKFEWCRIKLPKKFTCYISKDYVKRIEPGKVKVTGSKVNLRSNPSLKSHIIGQVTKGTVLNSKGSLNDWIKIEAYPHTKGWVHSKFLQKDNKQKELNAFIEDVMPKLSQGNIDQKGELHKALAQKGEKIIPLLEQYLSGADKNTSYSIISVMSQLVKDNPELAAYFLEKAADAPPKQASIYLDSAQEIIKAAELKKAYYHLLEEGEISEQDLEEASDLIKKALKDFKEVQ